MKIHITDYSKTHLAETKELLIHLASIPAPSYKEEKKSAFILEWLKNNVSDNAYTDQVGNVIFPYHCDKYENIIVYMAHMDVVFPDTEPFQIKEEGEYLYCPGIKDDNADLATLLMCAKYVSENQIDVGHGILFVANVCEEGLGNLLGSKKIYEDFKDRIESVISFDGNLDRIVNDAVGSQRYKITVTTQGGHSYNAFGNENAIHQLSQLICELYRVKLPELSKTTYNVGVIEGGTSVNTIAQSASVLYEFRSNNTECLSYMERNLFNVIDDLKCKGMNIFVEVLGIRPCASEDLSEEKMNELTKKCFSIIKKYTDLVICNTAGSTDANTFVSKGIPSITIGTSYGGKTHTREEWLRTDYIEVGLNIGLDVVNMI